MFTLEIQIKAAVFVAASLAASVAIGACAPRDYLIDTEVAAPDAIQESFTDDGLLMLRFDSTGSGTPDTTKYFVVLDEHGEVTDEVEGLYLGDLIAEEGGIIHSSRTRLLRSELDLDGDGQPDVVRHYNHNTQLIREESEPRGDGTFGTVTYFANGQPMRTELTAGDATRPSVIRHYRGGSLHFIEEDTNGDGQIDLWRYYRADQLVRVGRDLDGDGEVDRWEVIQRTGSLRIRDREGRESFDDDSDSLTDD